MRILLVTDDLHPGGIARHVTTLANGLFERGHSVAVAATDGPFRRHLRHGVGIRALSLFNPDTFSKRYTGLLPSLGVLDAELRAERYDIVHSHHRLSDLIARLASRRAGTCHVSTCHSLFTSLKMLSWFGDETITGSDAVRSALVEQFRKDPGHVHKIHLGIRPLERLSPVNATACRKRIGAGTRQVIASVGRLEKLKDRTTLLKAIHILQQNRKSGDALFVIVGDGPERPVLVRTIRQLHIEPSVVLLDSSTNVADIFNVADFGVLSSLREGGTVYVNLEAASLEKPHIATNVGGIPEFIEDRVTGMLVPPRSPERLADAIASLIRNPAEVRRLGRNAYERYIERHGYDRFIDETIAVYEKALQEKSRTTGAT
ncbi:MAG TPA: glycosyltransferase family 4 protein [Bacteroidota bacterium]|nr:glycosyltransferase family 4 protein [Bacteroidota bacterium]